MSVFVGVVPSSPVHIHAQRGNVILKPKEYTFGNTTVIVHSKLAHMNREEQRNWFQQEWENGNPVLKHIVEAAYNCQLHPKKSS
ncbi:hypothetical protein [Litchfieldia salsa]|uniref:Uncharacterized protein n=1 Tax=Litchfieldia salsa TaxID=930152 RepID=A0A1H0VPN2_9BACI|nr:hypothetical protein [Litchfieldia salsa]SDP80294.1 hypothetical protein SAMN05216565_107121 [Litchfieldia salsa]